MLPNRMRNIHTYPVEMFDGIKCKFESWIASVKNVAQISKQEIIYLAFSKMIGSPLTLAHRLRDHLTYLIWKDLKSKLSGQYSTTPLDSHATKVFAPLQQGPD